VKLEKRLSRLPFPGSKPSGWAGGKSERCVSADAQPSKSAEMCPQNRRNRLKKGRRSNSLTPRVVNVDPRIRFMPRGRPRGSRKWWREYRTADWRLRSRAHPDLPGAYSAFINRMYFYPKGSAATQGGRSHLPQLSKEAKAARRQLAWTAFRLRVVDGYSQRQIALELGVSQSTVARWLQGVPRVKQDQKAEENRLAAEWYEQRINFSCSVPADGRMKVPKGIFCSPYLHVTCTKGRPVRCNRPLTRSVAGLHY
jgi:hypothetical protein